MKKFAIAYKVVGSDGDGIPFWKVVEVHGGMELWSKGMSQDKQEMIDLAKKLTEEIDNQ